MNSKSNFWNVIPATTIGTLIQWYDFYIFGSLAVVLSTKFFPSDNPVTSFLSTLGTFAAGFVIRPLGALIFGELGDIVGRKIAFMATLFIMGVSTFLIGCVPTYETIGYTAPVLVVLLRLIQGLALGGEYGGGVIFVAEHAPKNKRGLWTSWIQTTASIGLLMSLLIIFATKTYLGNDTFLEWGWRVPFWASIIFLIIAFVARKRMGESPIFAKAKAENRVSHNPVKDTLVNKANRKLVFLALFGATMGQGVVWYTGQFYALNFMKTVMQIESNQVDTVVSIAIIMAIPLFFFFGWLSDKIGRKYIILAGLLLAVVSYRFIYEDMYQTANLENKKAVTVAHNSALKQPEVYPKTTQYTDGTVVKETLDKKSKTPKVTLTKTLTNDAQWHLIWMVFLQIVFVTMVYAPIASYLVELFAVSVRYTTLSFAYHTGNGIFGGLVPVVSTYLVTSAKDAANPAFYLEGLWYPIIVASICFIVGLIFLKNNIPNSIEN
ncbi:MFS transporter [Flavobacterium croceum]|uniref:MFS transporter n=1 Tax=Flavobacterium croceum TaxID=370975 RepID=UPI0024A99710|nr:MFS transporter [Flavobacterium croceum]